jgi:outer membrane protein OmpA-like peptidoglycan-associated protein
LRLLLGLFVAAATLVVAAPTASSQEHPDARNTAIDANPFRLDPAGIGVFATGSAETLTHLEFRVSAVGQHLSNPLVVVPDEDIMPAASDGSERALVGQRQQLDISAAVGLFGRAELGFVLPTTLSQTAQFPGFGLGPVDSSGLGNAEVYGLVNILSQRNFPLAVAVGAPVYLPTHTGNGYFGHDGVSAAPQLRLTRQFGPVRLSASGDVLFQQPTSLNNVDDGRRIRWKSGVLVQPTDAWGVGAEFLGSTPLESAFAAEHASRAEVVVGGRFRPTRQIDLQLAVGRGVLRGFGSPDFRATLGVSFHYGRPNRGPSLARCKRAAQGGGDMPPHGCPQADFDDDGLANADDTCPESPEDVDGFEDDDGCPDPDNDGDQVADENDACPNITEDRDGFRDDDGCPDRDNDGDGFADGDDECPDAPEQFDGFEDDDGCPDRDNDNDGLSDLNDECPDEAGKVDSNGCPDQQAPEARVTRERIEISEKIFFVSDRAIIRDRSHPVLEEVGKALEEHPAIQKLEIRGYADERGKSKYNYYLSWERAKVVRQYLIDHAGISPDRLEAAGYGVWNQDDNSKAADPAGESSRESSGEGKKAPESEKEWAKARRVEFKILDRADDAPTSDANSE